jgi:hypothetical protein
MLLLQVIKVCLARINWRNSDIHVDESCHKQGENTSHNTLGGSNYTQWWKWDKINCSLGLQGGSLLYFIHSIKNAVSKSDGGMSGLHNFAED